MESGNGVADVLYGAVSPSGRLADTIARHYEDYPSSANFGGKEFNDYAEGIFVGYRHFETFAPEKVLYPFGFGLSYTTFDVSTPGVLRDMSDPSSVIPVITKNDFEALVGSGVISEGMIPKLQNAFDAIAAGVSKVVITSPSALSGGTSVQANPESDD